MYLMSVLGRNMIIFKEMNSHGVMMRKWVIHPLCRVFCCSHPLRCTFTTNSIKKSPNASLYLVEHGYKWFIRWTLCLILLKQRKHVCGIHFLDDAPPWLGCFERQHKAILSQLQTEKSRQLAKLSHSADLLNWLLSCFLKLSLDCMQHRIVLDLQSSGGLPQNNSLPWNSIWVKSFLECGHFVCVLRRLENLLEKHKLTFPLCQFQKSWPQMISLSAK